MGTQAPLLRLEGLSKQYPSTEGAAPLYILKEVTLDIAQGEAVAIIGPSGSGKSTLLNVLGTLDKPTSGKVTFAGRDVTQLDELALAALRNREIGFIFQSHHLLPQCTVLENVLVPTLASGSTRGTETVARAKRLLDRVGLSPRSNHQPGQLSGGERQRVAVVRALINQPKLVLADEPTGALDRVSADKLAQLLVELNKEEGVTLILVTHALDLAKKMGRILELQDGKLVEKKS
ncbi:MAG: lolD 4 [Verrucomicrobia bacterium]|jgi:ABC-type lipoprotein export system ATPase subunit|nr:lolD 4 [Verrucomicrobiota bacterium]